MDNKILQRSTENVPIGQHLELSKANCYYTNRSYVFSALAIIVLIIGIIGSILFTFRHNLVLTINSIAGTLSLSAMLFAIYLHLDNQETLVQMQAIANVINITLAVSESSNSDAESK